MGQYEVYLWLKNKREGGDESFFTPKEIEKATNMFGKAVRGDCFRLTTSGYLEVMDMDKTGWSNMRKAFRIKKEYCEKNGASK